MRFLGGLLYDDAGGSNAGSGYLLYGPLVEGTVDLSVANTRFVGEYSEDLTGMSISTAGDLNGDGYSDIIIGATGNDAGGSKAGAAYIIYAGPAE